MHRQARGTRGKAQPEGCALLTLARRSEKELGACSLRLNRLARVFGKFLASGFFDEGRASEKSEYHRINTGDLWWAWVDLNHRSRPYQDSVVRSYKDLQVPRGLPKTAQGRIRPLKLWVEDSGFRRSLDRRRPVVESSHIARGLALASSHSRETEHIAQL